MDDKVNDFLNEINQITTQPAKPAQDEEEWKQCFDELTGYAYYWNKKTDKVTWDPPEKFKKYGKTSFPKKTLYIPEKTGSVIITQPSAKDVKIYSIGENSKNVALHSAKVKIEPRKKIRKKGSDSEDEKITLISSYGPDSESEDEKIIKEETPKIKEESLKPKSEDEEDDEEDDDEIDILAKIQKRAQELQALGGDIPTEVKNTVEVSKIELQKTESSTPGMSLVAGYSDSEEESEEIKKEEKEKPISHSTLFPIAKAININDFQSSKPVDNNGTANTNTNINTKLDIPENFDNKPFQRKRRIDVALVNTGKRNKENNNIEESRKGLGFDLNSSSNKTNDSSIYQGLKKDGIAFVKSETLNPVSISITQETPAPRIIENDGSKKSLQMVNEMYSTLKEKLTFLNEGRPDISPVHLMVIQAETLFSAMHDGALKLSYLQKWLNDTCSELIKLEKEATPSGWRLEWHKTHKRYYYQNLNTGESQWEYPQPDLSANDDAMDISTTPPPFEEETNNIPSSPPLPPRISTPPPPPPPIISTLEPEVNCIDVPLPEEPKLQRVLDSSSQPLPPGVDRNEMVTSSKDSEIAETLNSAIDSFYSDIAAISSSPPPHPVPPDEKSLSEIYTTEVTSESASKKKKKTKVKLGPGLSMKKKGVSQLVEKWKNVQQEY